MDSGKTLEERHLALRIQVELCGRALGEYAAALSAAGAKLRALANEEENSMAKQMEHIPVAYPTTEQGLHSAQHVIGHALGRETLPASQLAAHGWVVAGAGLGVALPPDGPVGAVDTRVTVDESRQLQEFADLNAAGGMQLDPERWKALAKIVLGILLKLLVAVVVVVGFSAGARAAEQAPRPPQAPPVAQAKAAPAAPAPAKAAAKSCGCSSLCVCGCQQGEPCECRTLPTTAAPRAGFALPSGPAFFSAPAPSFRFFGGVGGGFRGGRGGC